MILSQLHFLYFITTMLAGGSVGWAVVDTIRLRRALRDDTSDPVVRDRIFGSLIGLMMCLIAAYGVIDFWA